MGKDGKRREKGREEGETWEHINFNFNFICATGEKGT